MTDALFPRVNIFRHGYHRAQVDDFFTMARAAYEQPVFDEQQVSAMDVRRAAFDLKRRGYDPAAVDQALDRLESAFATRVREQYVRAHGQDAWMQELARRAQVLYPRLRRPQGQRFKQPGRGKRGYDARQVDALLERLISFFDRGEPLSHDELRAATFSRKGRRGAYDERTVDAYLARAVDILMGAQ